MAYHILRDNIEEEFRRHWYILKGDVLQENEDQKYREITRGKASYTDYATALAFLSKCLQKYHKKEE